VEIQIEETWIDRFLWERQLVIPVSEQYSLTNLRVTLGQGVLQLKADLKEKPGTSVEVSASPRWDQESQLLLIENFQLDTTSKNLLLSAAGWFAQHFLQGKLDKKLEEQSNRLLKEQLEKLKSKPMEIPIPKGGNAHVMVEDIKVKELVITNHTIRIKAMLDASLKGHLM
jgi:hypothetical protein